LRDRVRVEKEYIRGVGAAGPGTSVLVVGRVSKDMFFGGDSVGERGKPAEKVGKDAFKKFLPGSAPVHSLMFMLVIW
jgi:RNA 3'-terminal phosphate cyclase